MPKYIICQSFKKFHRAVFSIAHPKYSNFGGILDPDGNTSFGFNTLDSVIVE